MIQLTRSYFEDNDVVYLAKDLLGKLIRTTFDGITTSALIIETEAYRAPEDKASHAFGNRRTKRTETMFGRGGHAYIYLNYGIHHLLNIVTGPMDIAHAVLIRAVYPWENVDVQFLRRKRIGQALDLSMYNGPGKLTEALGIRTDHNAIDLCLPESPIRIFDHKIAFSVEEIQSGPRIGIDYAEEWVNKPWRFTLNNSGIEKLRDHNR
jgi:DNA-3-methyladenine glycosylase